MTTTASVAAPVSVPSPRAARPLPSPTPYEQGTCGSDLVHAVRKTLHGQRAVCTGRPIVTFLSGRFDPAETHACPACADTLARTA